ncbi:MAG: exodeoxyribonuclease III [Clostridia bacterium]|nr:exodeoxyribonuclease III [Clostridia bacterium]
MKIISWNVNGIRACLGKGLMDYLAEENADIICIQETKCQPGQAVIELPGYTQFWNSAEKKGYSGTAIFTKAEPISSNFHIDAEGHDTEGRAITLEYKDFYMVTNYTPNAQDGLARIDYRLSWEAANREYLKKLDAKKPLILCGDLNVAHKEIDLKNPKTNVGNPGFSPQEREAFGQMLDCGFTDAFRHIYPDKTDAYTWWSYRMKARERNVGWRIDYFVVSDSIKDKINDVIIRSDVFGSDHCPIVLDIDLEF